MPATAPQFGRAPGAWPLLGHVVALQRRPLALLAQTRHVPTVPIPPAGR